MNQRDSSQTVHFVPVLSSPQRDSSKSSGLCILSYCGHSLPPLSPPTSCCCGLQPHPLYHPLSCHLSHLHQEDDTLLGMTWPGPLSHAMSHHVTPCHQLCQLHHNWPKKDIAANVSPKKPQVILMPQNWPILGQLAII